MADQGAGLTIANGGFDEDADGDGLADHWTASRGEGLSVSRDRGAGQGHAQRIGCAVPNRVGILAQSDTLSLKGAHWYRLEFAVKGEGSVPPEGTVSLVDTAAGWQRWLCQSFATRPQWRHVAAVFRARRTAAEGLLLHFEAYFPDVGSVWFDDVKLTETEPPHIEHEYTWALPDTKAKNLLPNSSFECGASGWGSIDFHSGFPPGWPGNLVRLLGEVDATTSARHRSSLRIGWRRDSAPVLYFDCFPLTRRLVLSPLLANQGWIAVQPGADYTFSAHVKAAPAGLPCVMVAYQAFADPLERRFTAAQDWARVTFTFRPTAGQVFVAIGPDLTGSDLEEAALWVDALQLERGPSATAYEARAEAEVGIEWPEHGHLFASPRGAQAFITAFNPSSETRQVRVRAEVTDFFDEVAARPRLEFDLPPGGRARELLDLGVSRKGAYRLRLTAEGALVIPARPERFAVIDTCGDGDGLFGMNHAYPWDDLNRLGRRFGLLWFRDWSLKWNDVEPERGRFEFGETDQQVDRVLANRQKVLGLLPSPSSNWSSSAPDAVSPYGRDIGVFSPASYMPRSLDEFAHYVRKTVLHYRARIGAWEVLNEPIYTGYSLPAAKGYTPADYVKLLAVAHQAIKEADPDALVIGGIAGEPGSHVAAFIEAGGLDCIDAINLHIYPCLRKPEVYEPELEQLNELMRRAGRPRPIWSTEGAYYADDYLSVDRHLYEGWVQPLAGERECAAWQVRFNAILLGHGVRRIIYHSGTTGSVNADGLEGIFFAWDAAPRKMVAAHAAQAALLGPDTISLGRLRERPRAYGFHSRGRTVAILWSDGLGGHSLASGAGARLLDVLGNEIEEGKARLTETPCYLVFDAIIGGEEVGGLLGSWLGAGG